jgi:hypothetical protein
MDSAPSSSPRADSPTARFERWESRGPSWMNTAWLLVPTLRQLGYYEDADRVLRSLEVTVDRFGYREYDNPLTGRGLAARGFGFSTMLIDLLAECGNDPGQPSAAQRMMRS